MPRWSVPRLWEGRTVVVMASGASMSREVAEAVRRSWLPTIAVNNTFLLCPWANMLYAADASWWRVHESAALAFAGLKVTCYVNIPYPEVNVLVPSGITGFDPRPNRIRTGGNSGYQAVHVAIQTGAARILLCGFNMCGQHWFGSHPLPLRNPDPGSLQKWASRFKGLVGHGAEIINCTPHSALTCFPFVPLEEALRETQS